MNPQKCPSCGKDITDTEFSTDSDVGGFIDIGYECISCGIEIYRFKVEPLRPSTDDDMS